MLSQNLPADTLRATSDFAARIASAYETHSIMQSGSRARGTAHAESNADVAVVLKGAPGHFVRTKLDMSDLTCGILLDTGIRIQALPERESDWAHPENYANPYLLYNLAREGIAMS